MAIDGFFIKHLILELKQELKHSRLEKIEQLNENYFYFSFYYRKIRKYLAFKLNAPNASVFLTDKVKRHEPITTNFLKSLKKALEGSVLNDISQYHNDRVIIFKFITRDFLEGKVEVQLILELMGRHNNLILTKNNIIIDAYSKRFSENSRSILPKLEFSYFPSNKKTLENIDYNNFTTKNYLSKNYTGVSPLLSNYLFDNKVDIFNIDVNPIKDLDSNKYYWFDLFTNSNNKKSYNTLSELLKSNILLPSISVDKQINFTNDKIIKTKKRLNILKKDLEIAHSNLDSRNIGDAIYSSGLNLSKNTSSITDLEGNTIKLDSKYSLNENAQRAYTKYQKAKRAIKKLQQLIDDLQINLNILLDTKYYLSLDNPDLESIETDLKAFGYNVKKKRKKQVHNNESDPIRLEFKNNIIYVGKNSRQNAIITHEIANYRDYWLHVKDAPGSHVVIKSNNPSDEVLEFAAMLAAKYSKLKYANKVPVNYTLVKNVKKIPGRPGSQVIIKDYETILIKIDEDLIKDAFSANSLNYKML